MGSVYEAEHLSLRRKVAIKVIRKEHAGDGEITARFEREAIAIARIDHPHVAGALDFGELDSGEAYLVMPLVRGPSLQEEIETQGALPWPRVAALGAQVADALAAAHAVGIIHRDLKPDNIMLDRREDGTEVARVLDFGIATIVKGSNALDDSAAEKPLTRRGTVVGTPGYMAPEQALGDEVDAAADLYSLGVVLWESLTGKSLFKGRDLTSIVAKQLTERMPTVTNETGNAEIPAELNELVAELLAGERRDRTLSACAVREKLMALPLRASSANELAAIAARTPAGSPTLPAPTIEGTKSQAKVFWIVVGAALGALLASGAAGLLLLEPDDNAGEGAPEVAAEATSPPSPEVQKHLEGMLSDNLRAERRGHASWLIEHRAQAIPPFALAAAELELARSCAERRDALNAIRAIGNAKARPTVERYYERPPSGCGPDGQTDCYACIREELEATMSILSKAADPTATR